MKKLRWYVAALMTFLATTVQASNISVAVASNFATPMQRIATAFEQETGHKAVLAFGSTGKFYAQIKNGAPFQILLSADHETPLRLAQEGFAQRTSGFTYAIGRLALWSSTPGLVDDKGSILRAGRFNHLAVADPRLAPYGTAAQQTLEKLSLTAALQAKLVIGESVGQAYQFVATGNAELGFVALAQVMLDGKITQGSAWLVPQSLYDPLRQDAVLLKPGQGNLAALALMAFLRSEKARAIMRDYGYEQ